MQRICNKVSWTVEAQLKQLVTHSVEHAQKDKPPDDVPGQTIRDPKFDLLCSAHESSSSVGEQGIRMSVCSHQHGTKPMTFSSSSSSKARIHQYYSQEAHKPESSQCRLHMTGSFLTRVTSTFGVGSYRPVPQRPSGLTTPSFSHDLHFPVPASDRRSPGA